MLSERRAALRVLRRSIEGGLFRHPYLMSDPLISGIRREPEFARLSEKARQRHEEFKRRFL